jgi:hypothetical protein
MHSVDWCIMLALVLFIAPALVFATESDPAAPAIDSATWELYGDGQEQRGLVIPLDLSIYLQYLEQRGTCTRFNASGNGDIRGTCKDLFLDFTGTWSGDDNSHVTSPIEIAIVLWHFNQTFEPQNRTVSIVWDNSEEIITGTHEVPVPVDPSRRELLGYSYTDNMCEVAYGAADRRHTDGDETSLRYHCRISAVLDSLLPDLPPERFVFPFDQRADAVVPERITVDFFALGFHLVRPTEHAFLVHPFQRMQGNNQRERFQPQGVLQNEQAAIRLFWTMGVRKYQYAGSNLTVFAPVHIENATLRGDSVLRAFPDARLVLAYVTPDPPPSPALTVTPSKPPAAEDATVLGFTISEMTKMTGPTVVIIFLIGLLLVLGARKVVLAIQRRRQLNADRDRVAMSSLTGIIDGDEYDDGRDDSSMSTSSGMFSGSRNITGYRWTKKAVAHCLCGPCARRGANIYSATGSINEGDDRNKQRDTIIIQADDSNDDRAK